MKQFLSYQCFHREPLHQPCTAKTLQAGQAAHAGKCPGLIELEGLQHIYGNNLRNKSYLHRISLQADVFTFDKQQRFLQRLQLQSRKTLNKLPHLTQSPMSNHSHGTKELFCQESKGFYRQLVPYTVALKVQTASVAGVTKFKTKVSHMQKRLKKKIKKTPESSI